MTGWNHGGWGQGGGQGGHGGFGQGGGGGGFGHGGSGQGGGHGGFGHGGGHGGHGGFGHGGGHGGFGHGGGHGGFGHGGAFGPSGGGPPQGDGPLAHIAFTPDELEQLRAAARYARGAAIAAVASGGLDFVAGVINGTRSSYVALGITIVLAVTLFKAAKSLDTVVTRDDADQAHLMDAFGSLRHYFIAKGALGLVAIVLGCCALVLIGAAASLVLGRFG
jgi:hypothetical protein